MTPRLSSEQHAVDATPNGGSDKPRSSRFLARLVSAVVEPVWYWLNLFGPDGRPSNSKVIATAAHLGSLVMLLSMGVRYAAQGKDPSESFVLLALGLVGAATGHDLVKALAKAKASAAAPPEPTP
jgi:hypothetical protein